jgi:hypothetical protein
MCPHRIRSAPSVPLDAPGADLETTTDHLTAQVAATVRGLAPPGTKSGPGGLPAVRQGGVCRGALPAPTAPPSTTVLYAVTGTSASPARTAAPAPLGDASVHRPSVRGTARCTGIRGGGGEDVLRAALPQMPGSTRSHEAGTDQEVAW